MEKPDYSAMDFKELRAYVIKHPRDQEAFYELADRITSNPNLKTTYTISDIDRLPEILRESGKLPKQAEQEGF